MSINKKYITQSREPFYELASNLIKENDLVLDIGAGNGSFAKHCKNNEIYLVDGNFQTVSNNLKSYKNYFHSVLPILPFEDKKFNLIHCSHVVEHLDAETLYQTVKEMDRCLKLGGHLVISSPLLTDFFYNDLSHVKPYNPEVFIKYLTKGQFENLTREKISNTYSVLNLTFRYKKVKFITGDFVLPIDFFLRILEKIGICKYIKTGYTLVLYKMN